MLQNHLAVIDCLLDQYSLADFSSVDRHMLADPTYGGNPNFAVIRSVRGTAFLQKYELEGRNPSHINAALENYEKVVELYPTWGKRWLSPGVVTYLSLFVFRLTKEPGLDFIQENRALILWGKVLEILEEEADYWLATPLPLTPWISFESWDTKAEENAWLAGPFAAAEVFLPKAENRPKWAARARMLAYNAITRPSDPPYIPPADSPYQEVIKTITVSEEFVLVNHGEESPFYANATLLLLQLGALPYRVTGQEIPPEFYHNVSGLWEKARSYIATGPKGEFLVDQNGEYYWNRNNLIDPAKPMNFPWAMGQEYSLESTFVAQQAESGFIWSVYPVKVVGDIMTNGTIAWYTVQNHKGGWYHQIGSYEWHWPTAQ